MHSKIVLFTLAVVFMASSTLAEIGGYHHHDSKHDYHAVPKYAYSYGVRDKSTGDFKHAQEERDGDVTRGFYSVLMPDGVLRTVKYRVDPVHGYQAQVINSGFAAHPKGLGHDHDFGKGYYR